MKIKVDKERCIGCGLCAKVCPFMVFEAKEKACIKRDDSCVSCFQCIAVCPEGAISSEDCYPEDMQSYNEPFNPSPEDVINFMKTRRSIRLYQKRKIEDEKIRYIMEAGRLSPTGCNRQSLRFILLDNKLEEFKLLCMRRTKEYVLNTPSEASVLTQQKKDKFSYLYDEYLRTGQDFLFFNAPALLVIVADTRPGGNYTLDGGIAAAHMALMAYACGLGVCYVGNLKLAAEICTDLKKYLGLKEYEEIVASMSIGYPDIKYQRTVSRKKADISYM